MNTELEMYRRETFNKWWNEENLESKVNKLSEFRKVLFRRQKEGFLEQNIYHNVIDDVDFLKNRPFEEQKNEFDELFENCYKPFILNLLNVLLHGSMNNS